MQINVLEYLEATVRRFPDKPALVDRSGTITFAALRAHALALAERLHRTADCRKQPVAVLLPKSREAVASFLAILYCGGFYVPLDAKSPPARLAKVLENLQPRFVITDSGRHALLQEAGWSSEQTVCLTEPLASAPPEAPAPTTVWQTLLDTDPVYVIYTSGSTGTPKGVVISHGGVIDFIEWARACYRITEQDTIGSQAPLFFDVSTMDLYLCLACGATLVLVPEELFTYPAQLIEYIRQAGITTFCWVPSVLTNVAKFKVLDEAPLPPLTKVMFAGEVMPARTLNYWRQKFPGALFSNLYGPTETTVISTYYIVDREFRDHESLPIGFPCGNTGVLILDEHHQSAPPGQTGELCVRGSSLALGYWNAPAATAAAFVPNPLQPGWPERIYRTGDLVYRNPRGEIIYVGRKDSQIKHRGYRIELGEIEAIAGGIDSIHRACVHYHEERKEIILCYEADWELAPGFIRAKLAPHLPKYMLPTAVHRFSPLPLNANGKIDRPQLARQLGTTPLR